MTSPEQTPDVDPQQFDIDMSQLSPLAEAVDYLDFAQTYASNTLKTFLAEPTNPIVVEKLSEDYSRVVSFYADCINEINAEDTDRDTKINIITELTIGESKRRIRAFGEQFPDQRKLFKPYNRKNVRTTIEAIYQKHESEKKRTKVLVGMFGTTLQAQLTQMLEYNKAQALQQVEQEINAYEYVSDVPEQTPRIDKRQLFIAIGEQALEVIKIGAGIAAGVIVASQVTKRR